MSTPKLFSRILRIIRNQRYNSLKKLLVICFMIMIIYLILDNRKFKDVSKTPDIQQRQNQEEQTRRKQRISKVCLDEMENSSHLRAPAGRFLFYSPLRLSYCVVAKAGCSFWISIMRILLGDFSNSVTKKYPLEVSKLEAHGPRKKMRHLTRTNGMDILLNSTTFFFARNPYTRLLSGFMDKIYLPELWHSLNVHIAELTRKGFTKKGVKCVNDITFSEFLQYVVHSENKNVQRNGHWVPVYRTCNPCLWNFDFIGKQESFVKDSVFILKHFGLNHMMKNYSHIQNMVHQTTSQIEYTFYANHFQISKCGYSYQVFAERLWYAFQLQGYIRRNSSVPEFDFGSQLGDSAKLFQEIVIEEIEEHTISHAESKLQKESMLQEAYARVPQSVISQIQQVYDLDFKLFGYDKESYRH